MQPVIHPPAADGSVTVELAYPIQRRGVEGITTSVTLRRARGGDLRATLGILNDEARGLALVERLSGWLPADVDALDVVDTLALCEVAGDFLTRGQPTP